MAGATSDCLARATLDVALAIYYDVVAAVALPERLQLLQVER